MSPPLFSLTRQEGLVITSMTSEQREQVYAIIRAFNIYLPDGPLEHRMNLIRKYEDQTYFSWIGKSGLDDPYYYCIHSPVSFTEVRAAQKTLEAGEDFAVKRQILTYTLSLILSLYCSSNPCSLTFTVVVSIKDW